MTLTRQEPDALELEFAAGSIRLTSVGERVIRVERSRIDGTYCDDETFTVVARPEGAMRLSADADAESVEITCADSKGDQAVALIRGDADAASVDAFLSSVAVIMHNRVVWSPDADPGLLAVPPQPDSLPRPSEVADVWVLHDAPRVIPPVGDNDWRVEDEAFDTYLFLYEASLDLLRRDFLAITGEIPVPALWTFGLWTSRYYPYSADTALDVIDRYRELGIPLDVFVVDTDWRVGASRGYEVNTELFPDMERFLRTCRERGIRTVFNDHPEPKGMEALDPALFEYRRQNLTKLLDMGLTAWWFDRNWGDIIPGPVPGLETAVWGQKLYVDIISRHRSRERPVILSMTTDHPAAHRYPVWWTGDNFSDWQALAESVRDTISDGYQGRPYTAPDIGGHIGFPSPEQYIRWVQWATVCPTFRLHCGPKNRYRYPWRFGEAALALTRDYVKMRYRLLPYLYSRAHRAASSGVPLLSGMEYADGFAGADASFARDTQFLLGDALLFAPITRPRQPETRDASLPHRFRRLLRRRVWTDVADQAYDTGRLPGSPPAEIGFDREIRINSLNSSEKSASWGRRYFVAWDGFYHAPEAGWYRFRLIGNGRKELRVDEAGHPQIRSTFDGGTVEAVLELTAGDHEIEVTFAQLGGGLPVIECAVSRVSEPVLGATESGTTSVWLPTGDWRNLRTGAIESGPRAVSVSSAIEELPGFARCGRVVSLAPVVAHTTTAYWPEITLEVLPHRGNGESTTAIVFDDGESTMYLTGESSSLPVRLSRSESTVRLEIPELEGSSTELSPVLTARFHLEPGDAPRSVRVNGADMEPRLAPAWKPRLTPLPLDDESAGYPNGDTLVVGSLHPGATVEITLK